MINTQTKMNELKSKVTELVLFMKEHNFNSASLNIDNIGDYTFCDIVYTDGNSHEQSFSYLIDTDSNDNLVPKNNDYKTKDVKKVDNVVITTKHEETNNLNSISTVIDHELDNIIVEKSVEKNTISLISTDKLSSELKTNDDRVDELSENYSNQFRISTDDLPQINYEELSLDIDSTYKEVQENNIHCDNYHDDLKSDSEDISHQEESVEDKPKDNPQSSASKSRKVIDYNEEFVYQKNVIERILREHNLIA